MKVLPKGLLSTASHVPSELHDLNTVELTQLLQLWKVYNANPSVHEGDAGFRLRNFFWRVWGSEHRCRAMDGSKLAQLFLRISEPCPLSVPTTQQVKKAKKKKPSKSQASPENPPEPQDQVPSTNRPPLHPILKKSSTSGESNKTTRLLLPSQEGENITRKPDNPPTPVPPTLPLQHLPPPPSKLTASTTSTVAPTTTATTTPRTAQKKPRNVVASKARNIKRRPVIMRRKSSQASTRNPSPQPSPLSESPPPAQGACGVFEPVDEPLSPKSIAKPNASTTGITSNTATANTHLPTPTAYLPDEDLNQPLELPPALLTSLKEILGKKKTSPPGSTRSTGTPPKPKWGFVTTDDWTHYDVRYVDAQNYEQPSSESLVDKGFRRRFSERLHQEQEFYSSSVAAATAAGMGLAEYLHSTSGESSSHYEQGSLVLSPKSKPDIPSADPIDVEDGRDHRDRVKHESGNGDSVGFTKVSTAATSLPVMTPEGREGEETLFGAHHPRRTSGLPLTPFSLPRGRSQLSFIIEESRKDKLDTSEAAT